MTPFTSFSKSKYLVTKISMNCFQNRPILIEILRLPQLSIIQIAAESHGVNPVGTKVDGVNHLCVIVVEGVRSLVGAHVGVVGAVVAVVVRASGLIGAGQILDKFGSQ